MTIFVTADQHLGHNNIIRLCGRPCGNVEIMDRMLIEAWNSVVTPKDTVYNLGDLFFTKPTKERREIFDKLNGQKFLIIGNHDDSRTLALPWGRTMHYAELRSGGTQVVLFHYPMESWNRSAHGSVHLHGHSHGKSSKRANRLDVGVDVVGFKPIPLEMAVGMAQLVEWHAP